MLPQRVGIMPSYSTGYKYPIVAVISIGMAALLVLSDPLVYIFSSEKYRKEIRIILNPLLSQINKFTRKPNPTSKTDTLTQRNSSSQVKA